jgi:hypothetical protein
MEKFFEIALGNVKEGDLNWREPCSCLVGVDFCQSFAGQMIFANKICRRGCSLAGLHATMRPWVVVSPFFSDCFQFTSES